MQISKSNKSNCIYTKSLDEVERYVVKVIQQFFETSEEKIEGNIDSIINEAIRRFKEEFQMYPEMFAVSSVNDMTGKVKITPGTIGAEPEITNKCTAFNKDFGNTKGSICEGNDIRLSDRREPLEHEHEEYIKTSDVEEYITTYLRNKGIVIEDDKIIIDNKNLEIKNAEIKEV